MSRYFKFIWTHKKKFGVLTVGVCWGLDLLYYRIIHGRLVRKLCYESMEEGRKPLVMDAKNKHITLIMNPMASNRKAKWRFQTYAEQMLLVSGFLINNVRTEKISEARELTKLIDRTNVIASVGGDGTLLEVVTGLLQRDDADEVVKKFAIGVIPVGDKNRFANRISPNKDITEQELIAQSTMAIVRNTMKSQDVMEVQVINPKADIITEDGKKVEFYTEVPKEPIELPKPVFCLSEIAIGQFRNVTQHAYNFPTLFPDVCAWVYGILRANRKKLKAEIRYTPPCPGCSTCSKAEPAETSYLSSVFAVFRPRVAVESLPLEKNPECGVWHSMCVDTPEFVVRPNPEGYLDVEIGKNINRFEFMREGWSRWKKEEPSNLQKIKCSEVEVIPESAPNFCSIDYEEFDFKPFKAKLLRKRIYLFAPCL